MVCFLTWLLYIKHSRSNRFFLHLCAFPLLLKVFFIKKKYLFWQLMTKLIEITLHFLIFTLFSLLIIKITFCFFFFNMSYEFSNYVTFFFIEWYCIPVIVSYVRIWWFEDQSLLQLWNKSMYLPKDVQQILMIFFWLSYTEICLLDIDGTEWPLKLLLQIWLVPF